MIVYRSAITGRFVTAEYAAANPDTTIRQTLPPWRWIARMKAKRIEARE